MIDEAEWQTRKQRIDTRLRAMLPPWRIIRYRPGLDLSTLACHAVEELPTANGPADHGLFVSGKLLGIVESIPHTSHADQLVKTCRDVFNQGDDFVKKITGNANVDRPLQRIREFRNRPHPKVVVTVDMLSTGVDIPALEFIVFLRPVKSRILWEQMLGRGTRLCPDINKSKFVVFDCFDRTLIQYFRNVSSFDIEPPGKTPLTLPEVIENIWQNVDRDYHVSILAKRLLRIDKDMNADARTQFAAWIPEGDMGRFAKQLPHALQHDFAGTMKLLRNPDFQKLLLEYPRAKRTFLTTIEDKDTVTSQKLERYGKFDNAEDYLDAFSEFVKANADKVAALSVLLQHPKEWRPAVLDELKRMLNQNGFEPEKLQRAHRVNGFKALADVISMVKHAAAQQAPLLTAEERVNRARRVGPEQVIEVQPLASFRAPLLWLTAIFWPHFLSARTFPFVPRPHRSFSGRQLDARRTGQHLGGRLGERTERLKKHPSSARLSCSMTERPHSITQDSGLMTAHA